MGEKVECFITRNFGFIDIQWQINHFCFETAKEDFLIHTPEILVEGTNATKWKMTLNPKKKLDEEVFFAVTLESLSCEVESNDIGVSFKVWLVDCKGNEFSVRRDCRQIKGNQSYEIILESEDYIREKMSPLIYCNGWLLIRCLLLVKDVDYDETVHETTVIGLKSLSDDLLNLFQTGTDYDVTVKINVADIKAHKAVLCSRSSVLSEIIEIRDKEAVIDLSNYDFIDYETAKYLLAFIYSGDISHLSRNASVLMYESALFFNLSSVKEYFSPHNLNMYTEIDVTRYAFSWVIRDCAQITEDCILSPIFVADYMETTWRLRLYMKGADNTDNYLSVYADVVNGEKPENSCFAFTIIDDSGDLWCERKHMFNNSNDVFGFENFVSKDYFKFKLEKLAIDILHVVFTIDVHKDDIFSYQEYTLKNESFDVNHFYWILSNELTKLDCSTKYADSLCTIEVDDDFNNVVIRDFNNVPVYKSVFSARSPVLLKLLLNSATDWKSLILSMGSNVLRTVLHYIYSGVCNNIGEPEIFDLYRAAEYFALKHLKEDCTKVLQEHLSTKSVCEVLTFAYEQKDDGLKSSALSFISANSNKVFQENSWENIVIKYPFIRTEVEEYIKSNSIAKNSK